MQNSKKRAIYIPDLKPTKEEPLSTRKIVKAKKTSNPKYTTVLPATVEGDLLPRVAVVHHPNGRKRTYWLTHLPAHEVRGFWEMKDQDKLRFLRERFNKHHRRPRVQGGKRGANLSNVDIVSHGMYNNLIQLVSKNSHIPLAAVKTFHIQRFLSQVLPVVQRLLIDQDTGHLHGPDALERIMNHVWLPENEPIRFYAHDNSYPPK